MNLKPGDLNLDVFVCSGSLMDSKFLVMSALSYIGLLVGHGYTACVPTFKLIIYIIWILEDLSK